MVTCTPLADYHQLYLAPPEVWPEFDPDQADQLVQVSEDQRSLIILTGIAMGPVTLHVNLLEGPAGPGDALNSRDGTEDTASGVLQLDQPLHVLAPTVDTGVVEPVLTPPHPGLYRFRLAARGRQDHVDDYVDSPVETYHLEMWPTSPQEQPPH